MGLKGGYDILGKSKPSIMPKLKALMVESKPYHVHFYVSFVKFYPTGLHGTSKKQGKTRPFCAAKHI